MKLKIIFKKIDENLGLDGIFIKKKLETKDQSANRKNCAT